MTDGLVRVLLLEQIHPDAVEILVGRVRRRGRRPRAGRGRAGRSASAAWRCSASARRRTSPRGSSTPRRQLVAIGAFCIGTNQIDLAAASERGVTVFNAPFSNTRSVVELAIAEIIAMTRRLTEKNALMHDGVWDKSADGAHEVRGRTLGIVGYGNIGTQLSVLAENLGMKVLFFDTADKLALGNARRVPVAEGAAGRGRRRHAARRRAAGQRELLRRGRLRRRCAGLAVPQPVPRVRRRLRRPARATSSPGTSPARPWTCSRSSPRAAATSSCPSCAGCPTSS